ncbi:MAG: HlyD family efflux transporter periplasmic adaptor subunit, partial [Rhizobiaceae bacterium]|nr:HlyD family efflux transporter periplasmic adaptor subunit [Rhizobiaceae bacterium]
RKLKLMAKGIAAGSEDEIADTVRLEDTKVEAAKLAVAKLSTELDFARKGVYVGAELQSLQNLQLEIRTRKADLLQIKMQLATMQSKEAELNSLVMTESQRIDRLARADIRIPPSNILYKPVAASGREVTAGDTLAETLDCHQAFIVAIFSERQAQALAVGSKVQVNAEDWGQPVDGVVERLIPRTTERVDLDYAVPFPPTERRELYAYIRLTEFARSAVQSKQFCSVGTWVDVTMPHEWVQRTEDYIREASTSLVGIAQASAAQWPAAQAGLSGMVRQSAEQLGLTAFEDQHGKNQQDGLPLGDHIQLGRADENAADLLNARMGIPPRKG